MVALAIVATLATMAAPSFQNFLIRNSTAAIANEFTGSVLRARNAAVSRNMCTVMCRSNDTEAATPQCAGAKGDWQSGWMIFLNRGCDAIVTAPALDQIVDVVSATKPEFSLASDKTTTTDYIVFSPTGYSRASNAGGYGLRYRDETRASNRRICLNALGQVFTIDFTGSCL